MLQNSLARRMLLVVMLLVVMPILAGCGTTTALNGVSFCEASKPIGWVDADTDDTIREVKEHNAVGTKLNCKAVNPAWSPLR